MSAPDAGALVCPEGDFGFYDISAGTVIYYEMNASPPVAIGVVGADAASFRVLERGQCAAGNYARDKHAVYYKGSIVPGADAESFRPMNDGYASDTAWWYGGGKPIARRERGDLRILGTGWAAYASHTDGVFYGARRLEADGFQVLGRDGYAKSRNRAYYRGGEIPGIDPASFELLNDRWTARDKRNIVVKGRVQERLDAASFEHLGSTGGLTRDKNHVYLLSRPVEGADPATFAPIGFGYWRDAKSVYFSSRAISGADPASFRLIERRVAADKHRVYVDGKPLSGADPASFRILGHGYARDSQAIYIHDRRLDGADVESFVLMRAAGRAQDRSYGYRDGKRACVWSREVAPQLPVCDPNQFIRR